MVTVRRSAVAIIFIFLVATSAAFGSASNVSITQSGSPSGNCTTNVQTPSFFNNAANWGSGGSQIGPGTTVLLCGTFTSSAKGGNALTTQGNGTSSSPITVICDTICTFQSTGWWGATQEWGCGACSGAISVVNSYIILDGNNTGIIENMLAGNAGPASPGAATCLSGPCTQVPGNTGSAGIYVGANNVIIRNWTIQDIYNNFGSNTGNSDGGVGGQYTSDIWECCQGTVANIEIYNNTLANSRAGLTLGTGGTSGPNNCPATSTNFSGFSGTCLHQNTLTDHAWQMNSVQLAGTILNFYNNSVSDYANWFWPDPGGSNPSNNPYHLDGIIDWGIGGVGTMYIYNNYFSGDQAGPINGAYGDSTGFIYCSNTEGGPPGDGSASSCWIFNNVLVGTGGSATSANMMDLSVGGCGSSPGYPNGPYYLYNNTFYGMAHQMYIFWGNGCSTPHATQFHGANNVWQLNTNQDTGPFGGGAWFLQQDNAVPFTDFLSWDHNLYFNSAANPVTQWNWGLLSNNNYTLLPLWSVACLCDLHSQAGSDPKLSSSYTPQAGSAAIGAGANLSNLGINALNYDKPVNVGVGYGGLTGNPRAAQGTCTLGTAGCWDAGAYQYASSSAPPVTPPTGLTAIVH